MHSRASLLVLPVAAAALVVWAAADGSPPGPDAVSRPRTARAARPPQVARTSRPGLRLLGTNPWEALWSRVLALDAAGRTREALRLLAPALQAGHRFFQDPARRRRIEGMRKALRAADAAARLRALVRAGPQGKQADGPGSERALRAVAGVIAQVDAPADREVLLRHAERFLIGLVRPPARSHAPGPRTHAPARGPPDVDALLAALQAREAARPRAVPVLAVAHAEQVAARRTAQLQRLAQGGALGLLESLQGALAWLALSQGEDGRVDDATALARAAPPGGAAGRATRKLLGAGDRYALATTAFAALAFLDFRDQDAGGLFEPALARAVAWLRSRQRPDGLFRSDGRQLYDQAIALMALGQACRASGDAHLAQAVARGLASLYDGRGMQGGYRYQRGAAGDVSVSAWVAQALEQARLAHVPLPVRMEEDLRGFLGHVWKGGSSFSYTADGAQRPSLDPAGMLVARILLDRVEKKDAAAWRLRLARGKLSQRPALYTLYYGARMDVWLHGTLTPRWRGWLLELAGTQDADGLLAGSFAHARRRWISAATTRSAFCALILEHALFRR